jgi:TonB family protein
MLSEVDQPQINFDSMPSTLEPRRHAQLLFALVLLLAALVLVVFKNRQFWSDALNLEELTYKTTPGSVTKSVPPMNLTPSRKTVARQSASSIIGTHTGVVTETPEPVLSPLQVDVTYSSGQHQTIVARDSGVHIDLKQNPNFSSAATGAATSQTGIIGQGVRVRFSGQTIEIVGRPVEPIYPLLAQQENIQGAVVLQAQVNEDGNVQALRVISGPPMLTTAALEAVKQWHFKPHKDGEKAVPRETRITVNFAISAQ